MLLRILHTADWQLGKPFGSIKGDPAAVLREERFSAVGRVADLAAARAVDAVLVAGDVFDSPTVPDQVLRRALEAMRPYQGPWVLLPGNHDPALSESPWTRLQRLGLPANIHLALAPEPVLLAEGGLAVLPAPLTRRHEPDDLTEWMERCETPEGAVRVGLAHGSVVNFDPEGEARNAISDRRADTAGLSYLALGDWHGAREVAPRTWYSGTPEPDRFRDNDPGNALVITVGGPRGTPEVELVRVGRFAWRQCTVTCGVGGEVDPASAVEAAIGALAAEAPKKTLVRLALDGTATLADRLRVENCLDAWEARLHYLERDMARLLDEPDDDDLDALDRGGFVRSAVDRLVVKSRDGTDPQRDLARTALRLLYLEHTRAEG